MNKQNFSKMRDKKLREQVFYSLLLYKEMNGEKITIRKYEDFRKKYTFAPSVYHISKVCGGWKTGCRIIGLEVGSQYSKQEILESIHQAYLENNCYITAEKYRIWASKNEQPSLRTVLKKFGSWNEALLNVKFTYMLEEMNYKY